MDIFGKKKIEKMQDELLSIKKESEGERKKLLREMTELKGFYSDNINNEYLTELFRNIGNYTKWIDFSSYDRAKLVKTYETNAIVRGIVGTTIGNAVAELAQYVELVDSKGTVLTKRWEADLLNRPNDRFTKGKFIKAWAVNRLLTGDAFVFFEKGIGLKVDRFTSMYVINSQDVEIVSEGAAKPIKGFLLTGSANMNEIMTTDNVMMSFDYNTKSQSLYGLSPLASAANYLQVLESALARQNTALTKGGVSNIITPKADSLGINKIDADNLEEDMNKMRSNYNKILRVPIEVFRLGDTPADLSILDTSKYAINALCFVYGISVDTFLGQAKYENAKEAKKAIYEQAGIPLLNEFLEDYSNFCKLKAGERFIINTDKVEILRADPRAMLEVYKLAGTSINERRALLELPPVNKPFADEITTSLGESYGDPMAFDINENNQ